MSAFEPGKRVRVKALFDAVTDHVTGADIVRADKRSAESALQDAHFRAANLRERFLALRDLSRSMNEHLEEFKRRRSG